VWRGGMTDADTHVRRDRVAARATSSIVTWVILPYFRAGTERGVVLSQPFVCKICHEPAYSLVLIQQTAGTAECWYRACYEGEPDRTRPCVGCPMSSEFRRSSPGMNGCSPRDRSGRASRTNMIVRHPGGAPSLELRIFDRLDTQSGDFRTQVVV